MSIKEFVDKQQEHFDEIDRKYPNRHKHIHKVPCKNCPSTKGSDPEADDIKATCSKGLIATEFLFVCYCRESKLCKGYADFNDIDQDYLDKLYEQT